MSGISRHQMNGFRYIGGDKASLEQKKLMIVPVTRPIFLRVNFRSLETTVPLKDQALDVCGAQFTFKTTTQFQHTFQEGHRITNVFGQWAVVQGC